MFKRPRISLSSYGNIFSPYASNQGVSTDCRTASQTDSVSAHAHTSRRWKSHTHGSSNERCDSRSHGQPGNLPWPQLSSRTTIPTPYQIFHLDKDAIYTKRRFYELVKIYHPDRHISEKAISEMSSISSEERIERYRLVVAANDILSDPAKRSAYDRYGSGWGRHIDTRSQTRHSGFYYSTRPSGFDTYDSPMRNATWEDWERWYQRHNREKQEPVYFSNGTFLSMISVLAALAGVMQAKQMGEASFASLEQVEATTQECSKHLQSRRTASRELDNRNDRVQRFLESRSPYGNATLGPMDDDTEPKVLASPE